MNKKFINSTLDWIIGALIVCLIFEIMADIRQIKAEKVSLPIEAISIQP